MDNIARALILAIRHIEHRDETTTDDDDVKVMESIASWVLESSPAEQEAVRLAALEAGCPEIPGWLGLA